MSFKNLSIFNMAMLGKHGWKIRTNLDVLISKIYKVKYFPYCNLLDSSILDHKSIAMCVRVFSTPKLFLEHETNGWFWDGNDISVWNERSLDDGSVLVPQNIGELPNVNLCVFDLMHLDNKSWNTPLIFATFYWEIMSKKLILLRIILLFRLWEHNVGLDNICLNSL